MCSRRSVGIREVPAIEPSQTNQKTSVRRDRLYSTASARRRWNPVERSATDASWGTRERSLQRLRVRASSSPAVCICFRGQLPSRASKYLRCPFVAQMQTHPAQCIALAGPGVLQCTACRRKTVPWRPGLRRPVHRGRARPRWRVLVPSFAFLYRCLCLPLCLRRAPRSS